MPVARLTQPRILHTLARTAGAEEPRPVGRRRSWVVLYRSLLAVFVLGGAVVLPTAAGPVYSRSSPVRQRPAANPVGELFAAVSRCRASLAESERWQIAGAIHKESGKYGYDPLFVLAIAQVESTCSPRARGKRGAVGLIQLMPSTARALAEEMGIEWGGVEMLNSPVVNVQLGLRYLWQLERRFRDPYLAMAAYNMGPARVSRMPSERARSARYVRKILSRYEDLLKRYRAEST